MSNALKKIGNKDLAKGLLIARSSERGDVLYIRRKGKRVHLAFSYDVLFWVDPERTISTSKRVTETAILVRENGRWAWEKEFNTPSVLTYAQYLASFPMPIDGFDNRCNPVKNFRLFKNNWKRIVAFTVPVM